ncbi:MAG: Spy/CpxP family protein refolding chaperone [Hydrogenophaga sp.]|jgi:Spy/CpxP family protein refolding chaperone|uniref:Spy/CpxP family protein refolding chaperone n=1 Tax=Hydrogenophaga sp. TaxID=1904254 RepID=UPI002721A3B8|nr:Spy/CpxP family protein refolding chaperone [Hydrogenophaga sp.]MDO9483369.1 Spy/CpxP family protein refolding chaperone [Hydrogenophaga sp.]MDP3345934.1 Spy/CpxP family protein refolding chaperone [Hydrogenophaga sp.]MDP3807450.1 Spy/CpxP family protein refolding chaperone [Hydrogenophaga sp.]MDP3927236.1 Spy/CpxP family protein refolding chaperone [Hydrogenophaga sp.]MDZ4237345.1 Spy/CpxP family protein refolding chaperone [Hydrogenophaga sp.]
MKTTFRTVRCGAMLLALVVTGSLAVAKNVPGDAAIPVVELMPLTLRYEADLKLSAEQIQALADYRKQAMPGRIAVQKKIVELRGQLRMAILDNKPPAEREALMQQIAEAEVAHFKGRDRCVEALRKVLSAEQFAQLSKLYLDGLR